MNNEIRSEISERNEDAMLLDGHDNAIMGMVEIPGIGDIVLYDPQIIVKNLMDGGMTYEEAVEFFMFNINGAYFGTNTPAMFIRLATLEGDNESDVDEDKP
jgi:hypothetical protein